ncbi:MAG: hypothetical protein PVF17_09550 [Ignavibacteria bacterium]|jgi:translation initiation factor 2B subunit (eIF-2B alpha/beta/delta family)
MNSQQKTSLEKITTDKTSGSSEILLKLNKYFLRHCKNQKLITEAFVIARAELAHFTSALNYLSQIEKLIKISNQKDLITFLESFEADEINKLERIFKKIYRKLPGANTILTISKSGTLLEVFRLWHEKNKKLKIIVPESRPASEGKLMAKELLKSGIRVELITDAMTGIFIRKADAVLIGADSILKNGNVINKSGSLHLALLCKHTKKPFYVLSCKSKFQSKVRVPIREEPSDSIWDFSHKKLKITNIPFEEIDKKFITSIISE